MKHTAAINKEFVKYASDTDAQTLYNYQQMIMESKRDIMSFAERVKTLDEEFVGSMFNTLIENHLNAYEGVCALYNLGFVDATLIEVMFKSSLKQIVEGEQFEDKLFRSAPGCYDQIKETCKQWYGMEFPMSKTASVKEFRPLMYEELRLYPMGILVYRDDHYGPNNMTVFSSSKNDHGESGVFHVDWKRDHFQFSRMRTPFRLFEADIKSGRLKPSSLSEVINFQMQQDLIQPKGV